MSSRVKEMPQSEHFYLVGMHKQPKRFTDKPIKYQYKPMKVCVDMHRVAVRANPPRRGLPPASLRAVYQHVSSHVIILQS